ncbi:hypothetical protein K493DRAFT_310631 [Basidiobolus meristosporus CBS 931.73]|uniref:Extracellular membrane protein CFEM domain-containing protein n=1 Tax=Basidiobolus meristosporus CBS 931.73 TaxID=1314790 RepID=A0A1Y1Z7Q7_9FUNG|nr:hypothetical protein K493DRAFT_310631 [Basidiobolus meristosporus CBS 931.73]|eukprot:ORY06300.1 hypothetical protein K493DRAFT_310631 [Basidiobolus meristosporus CBS 931.73]
MKASTILATLCFVAGAQAATNYLIKAGAGNECEAADTYNQCIDNALTENCAATNNACNCKQAQTLVTCVGFCTKDPRIAGLGTAQQSEVTRWCAAASSTSALASTTVASSGSSSQPTNAQSSPSSAISQPATSPNGTNANKPSGAGKAEISLGLLGIAALISYVV